MLKIGKAIEVLERAKYSMEEITKNDAPYGIANLNMIEAQIVMAIQYLESDAEKIKFKWEQIDNYAGRVKVIGGWIVHIIHSGTTSMVFIPDPNHEWEIDKERTMSKCCNAEIKRIDTENNSYYVCVECGLPCEAK